MRFITIALIIAFLNASLVAGKGLKSRVMDNQVKKFKKSSIGTTAVSGSFPTNPTYGTIMYASGSDCSGTSSANSYVLDTCLSTMSGSSVKFTCTGGVPTRTSYTDAACTTGASAESAPTTCAANPSTSFAGDAYWMGKCGTTATSAIPSSMIQTTYYTTTGCSGNQIVNVEGANNNYCYPSDSTSSYKADWPNVNVYASADCSGASVGTFAIDSACSIEDTTDDFDYNTYSSTTYNAAGANFGLHTGILTAVLAAVWYMF